ncbi:MAG: hypothetical protein ACYDC1_12845 [Limisphaerales bacterium]
MRPRRLQLDAGREPRRGERGTVLVIVLWVAFGLVSLALYFAQTTNFELRAADHRLAALEAGQAIAGAARYVSNILASVEEPGMLPDPLTYEAEAVPVGDATFWLLGRDPQLMLSDQPVFALDDEAARLNLNTATAAMLELLPYMTPELAAAIVDWRDTDSDVSEAGAEDETYQMLNPPYRCKNGPFESVDELRLVFGADLELLLGEDTNRNGVLDPYENDGDESPPSDNRDGQMDPGILDLLTVSTREPNTGSDGSARVSVDGSAQTELATLLQGAFGTERANQILAAVGVPGGGGGGGPPGGGQPGGGGGSTATGIRSVLEFYLRSGMTEDEFMQVETGLTATTNQFAAGLVNVNTASEAVLACIPGIGIEKAPAVVGFRQANAASLGSMAWIKGVLEEAEAIEAGPYLTGRSYQYAADIAAVGRYGRGYQRVRLIFDISEGTPRISSRQDLSHLGWALGQDVREEFLLNRRAGTVAFGSARGFAR